MYILAIETSCDETAIAFIEASGGLRAPKFNILETAIASQIPIHRPFGGVVPNLAKREHLKNLPITYKKVLDKLKTENRRLKVNAICVTTGPGLEPALWTGIGFAKELYKELKKENPKLKLIGVNHLLGHLYSFLLTQKTEFQISNSKSLNKRRKKREKENAHDRVSIRELFPAIALIVSGGHTILLRMDSLTKWKKLGETQDDAVGEAFDKIAKMLKLPYPGGPEIQKIAKRGNSNAIEFPRPMIHNKNYNFSYSGLKTSVLYHLKDLKQKALNDGYKADVAASFQEAALDVLVKKTERATKEFGAKSIFLSGGVAANALLRKKFEATSKKLKVNFIASPMKFNTDNAVMIGVAGYISLMQKKFPRVSKAQGNMGV